MTHLLTRKPQTDNYFIGTVARIHGASRFARKKIAGDAPEFLHLSEDERVYRQQFFQDLAHEEITDNRDAVSDGEDIAMMVSLDHTIYFHSPLAFRADEWMFVEMDTPWAGNERGLVTQRIWSQNGLLVATCIQEGLIRVSQDQRESHL